MPLISRVPFDFWQADEGPNRGQRLPGGDKNRPSAVANNAVASPVRLLAGPIVLSSRYMSPLSVRAAQVGCLAD